MLFCVFLELKTTKMGWGNPELVDHPSSMFHSDKKKS